MFHWQFSNNAIALLRNTSVQSPSVSYTGRIHFSLRPMNALPSYIREIDLFFIFESLLLCVHSWNTLLVTIRLEHNVKINALPTHTMMIKPALLRKKGTHPSMVKVRCSEFILLICVA